MKKQKQRKLLRELFAQPNWNRHCYGSLIPYKTAKQTSQEMKDEIKASKGQPL